MRSLSREKMTLPQMFAEQSCSVNGESYSSSSLSPALPIEASPSDITRPMNSTLRVVVWLAFAISFWILREISRNNDITTMKLICPLSLLEYTISIAYVTLMEFKSSRQRESAVLLVLLPSIITLIFILKTHWRVLLFQLKEAHASWKEAVQKAKDQQNEQATALPNWLTLSLRSIWYYTAGNVFRYVSLTLFWTYLVFIELSGLKLSSLAPGIPRDRFRWFEAHQRTCTAAEERYTFNELGVQWVNVSLWSQCYFMTLPMLLLILSKQNEMDSTFLLIICALGSSLLFHGYGLFTTLQSDANSWLDLDCYNLRTDIDATQCWEYEIMKNTNDPILLAMREKEAVAVREAASTSKRESQIAALSTPKTVSASQRAKSLVKSFMPTLYSKKGSSKAESFECPICKEDMKKLTRQAMGCGHVLCKPCVDVVKRSMNKCPFCSKPIQVVITLYDT